ncbi:MAG: DUF5696 domain-containing protein [Firmicutes bacterium]|nr:DUF5696 domain-containing protein [Bacillota bacterium]
MTKKLTVIALVLLMALSMFSGCVQKAVEEWFIPEDKYTGLEEYKLSEDIIYHRDMGNGSTVDYYLVQENSSYELYLNKQRLDIVLVHKASGETWFSNPTQSVIDASGKAGEMMSQIQIRYNDKTSSSQMDLNSYTNCILMYEKAVEQGSKIMPFYLTYNDEGGLRVKYVIGNFQTDYKIPTIMPKQVFDEMLELATTFYNNELNGLSNDEKKDKWGVLYNVNYAAIKNAYKIFTKDTYDKLTDTAKEEYDKISPKLKNLEEGEEVAVLIQSLKDVNGNMFKNVFTMWYEGGEQFGYDYQGHKDEYPDFPDMVALRDYWHSEYDVADVSTNLFMIPLDYILEEDGLKVCIKNDEIMFNESKYCIAYLDVLKYFGSADQQEKGYMLTPDGSGALINFNNGKIAISDPLKVQIYGIDRGKDYSTQPEYSEQGYLPIWAIKKQNSTLFSIIEDGEAVASVVSDVPRGQNNTLNYTYSSYRLSEFDDMALFGASSTLKTYQEKKYSGDIAIKYTILPGDLDYADMAAYYREYLISKGLLKDRQISGNDINFNLELLGAMSDTGAFMGIQYDYLNSLTTYNEAQEILKKLTESGVKGINVRYRGWSNNGLLNQVYSSVRPLNELGGWGDYRDLQQYAQDNGIALYPECEVLLVYTDKLFDDYMKFLDASRMLSRSNAMYYQYNLMQTKYYMHQAFITKPQKVQSVSESLLKNLQSNKISAVSLGAIGNMLTGDYHVGALVDRNEVQQIYTDIYGMFSDAGVSIATVGGNMYTLAGTDVIYELPNQSSEFYMADETVPFYQLVIHGYIQYSGEFINQSGDSTTSMLKAVEYGAGIAYRWMYAPNKDINNVYFEDVYSVNYSAWIDDAIKFYNRYNEELGHTASLTMVKHDNISQTLTSTQYSDGTIVYVNYDEVSVSIDGYTVPARDYLVIKGV